MVKMLKHKETGELFIYTPLLAQNSFLELVTEDPVAVVLEELKAAETVESVEPPVAVETPAAVEVQVTNKVPKPERPVKPKKQAVKTDVDADLASALE